MKLHLFSNGQKYGWSKLRSFFDFFFPYKEYGKPYFYKWKSGNVQIWKKDAIIRCEAVTTRSKDGKIGRDFYTFRAFFVHYTYGSFLNYLRNSAREYEERWVALGFPKELVYKIGAIGFDAASFSGYQVTALTTYDLSHTCTGSNRILFFSVCDSQGRRNATPTYAGTNLLSGMTSNPGGNLVNMESWFLTNGASGTNNIHITFNPAGNFEIAGCSYSGAKNTSTLDATHLDTQTGSGSYTLTGSVTTVANNCWVFGFFGSTGAMGTMSTGTERWNNSDQSCGGDNNAAKTPAGSVSLAAPQTAGGSRTTHSHLLSFEPNTITAYTLAIGQGSDTLTGQTLGLIKALKIALVQGAYTLSGQVLLLKKMWNAALAQGAYVLTGIAVTLRTGIGYVITLAQGTYTLTGNAIAVLKHLSMALVHGAYTLTGQTLFLFKGWGMGLTHGVYTLTGEAVMLSKNIFLTMVHGTYTLTGEVVNFIKGQTAHLVQGIYTYTGSMQRAFVNGDLIGLWKKVGIATDRVWRKVSKHE